MPANGCQICDFVMYRKTLRPCVHCEKTNCEHFCEWCGNGYHTKCARIREEKVNSPNGFCCRKCEAEQADDEEVDPAVEELGARCGSCRLPFNGLAKEEDDNEEEETKKSELRPEESGFKVNQSVLVENEEVLYNAVITDVDTKGERIKIHFIRWSKSFDNWYAMDDERINESLACDCCNHWFHIGCLPPIKSSGRFKDTTYVCPTCIDDAKHFHNGTRAPSKSKSSFPQSSSNSKSTRKGSVSEDASVATSKRKSSKPIITSDDEQPEPKAKHLEREKSSKKKRKLSITSDSPVKKKPEVVRLSSRSKSKSPERLVSEVPGVAPTKTKNQEEQQSSPKTAPSSPKPVAAIEIQDDAAVKASTKSSKPKPTEKSVAEAVVAAPTSEKEPAKDPVPPMETPVSKPKAAAPAVVEKEPHKRKVSCHSVSSLLNSPSPNEKPSLPPVNSNVSSLPFLDDRRNTRNLSPSFDVLVKVENKDQLPPLPSSFSVRATSKSSTTVAKLEPYQNSNWPMRPSVQKSSNTGRGSLSAFDILREVATQSIGGDLDVAPAPKPKRPRTTKPKGEKAVKADKSTTTTTSSAGSKTGATSTASSTAEQDRLLFQSKERIHLNSFVDLHFNIRKEMYLTFCMLEEKGLIDRDTAQLLRSLIYPTSERFQDLKFVYLVNKDLPPVYLTKRLLEVVPTSLGGTGGALPLVSSGNGSKTTSPASTKSHTKQPLPTIVPSGLMIPSFSDIIAADKSIALHQTIRTPPGSTQQSTAAANHSVAFDAKKSSARPELAALHPPPPSKPKPPSQSTPVPSQPEQLITRS
uniref:Zinc finger PHD-type domain-containing protein n=1 Tax=Globisporangium ultimum (strain ATCC 200006 / CBS 805.95 / DAOM BR144) TaxID=431595 RepID=K3WB18_GLOUD